MIRSKARYQIELLKMELMIEDPDIGEDYAECIAIYKVLHPDSDYRQVVQGVAKLGGNKLAILRQMVSRLPRRIDEPRDEST